MAVTNGYERMKQREAEIAAQQQQQRQQELMQQQRQQDLMRQRRQQAQQQQPQTAPAQTQTATAAPISSGYKPGDDVTKAKQQMEDLQGKKPGAYTPGDSVTQAQQALDAINSGKPQGYQSKYGSALDGILQQIQNPQDFKYEFDGDELFKYYADLYTQKGKQASADAMGQAAALTGGYGNSYAQQVGNQAYDQYLLSLYDKGMDMRDRAYQQYQDQRGDLYNQFNVLQGADATDYDRYRDTVGDWERERDYLTGRYDTAQNFDYNQYQDALSQYNNDLNYYTDLYNNDRTFDYSKYADQRDYEQQVKQFDESVRQFNENLNWDKMSAQQKYAAEYAMQILAMGQMPSAELLQQAGLSAEDAQKMMAQLIEGGSGGGGGRRSTQATYYQDAAGHYYKLTDKGYVPVDPSEIQDTDLIDQSKRDYIQTSKSFYDTTAPTQQNTIGKYTKDLDTSKTDAKVGWKYSGTPVTTQQQKTTQPIDDKYKKQKNKK